MKVEPYFSYSFRLTLIELTYSAMKKILLSSANAIVVMLVQPKGLNGYGARKRISGVD